MQNEEEKLLKMLQKGDENALIAIIERYNSYVQTIIFNILTNSMTTEDIKETVSDVFLVLWNQAKKVQKGKLKAYLGAISRNLALKKLREKNFEISLYEDEDFFFISTENVEQKILAKECESIVFNALSELNETDKEIFLRHYYYCQKIEIIANEMNMNLSTVKTRLLRGRNKLKSFLEKGGYTNENP